MRTALQRFADDLPVSWKSLIVVAIPTAILMISLFLFANIERKTKVTMDNVRETMHTETLLYDVLNLTLDIETGTRGYRITRNPVFLEPYDYGQKFLPAKLKELTDTIKQRNPELTSHTVELQKLVMEKMALQITIRNQPADINFEELNPLLDTSKRIMDAIRSNILNIIKVKREHLEQESLRMEQLQATSNSVLTSLFILGLLASTLSIYLFSRSITSRLMVLQQNAENIMADKPLELNPQGKDEIGSLARSFERMNTILKARELAVEEAHAEQKRLNEQLERQLMEITDINKELEAFSYSVSHDLRAPLRHVAGFSEMMLKNSSSLDERNQRYLSIIVNSIRQMGTLIDDLLSFSRMGRASLKSDPTDLNVIVNEIKHELLSETEMKVIDWEIDELPVVVGDRSMIRLVLQNLISNAIKYSSPKPNPKIQIINATQAEDEEFIIKIKDNGAGFDMKYVDKLFGVFQRLHRNEEFEGTGIGLATVRRIIQRHGGRVAAMGKPGEGAEFTFTFPKIRTQ